MVSVAPVPVSSVDELSSLGWWYGEAGVEQQAEPESQLVELHNPTAPIPDSLAPFERTELDSLPLELPPCPSTTKGQVLGSDDFGKMVTVTGLLERRSPQCGDNGSLPRVPCIYLWYIANVTGSSEPLALAAAKPDSQDPESPVPIAATGILVPPHHGNELGLQQARVCALPSAPRQLP